MSRDRERLSVWNNVDPQSFKDYAWLMDTKAIAS